MAKFRQHLTLWQPRELFQDPLFKFPYLPGISLAISLFSRSFHYAFKVLYFKLVFLHTFGSLIFLPLCVPFQKSFSHSVFTSFACSFASVGSISSFIPNAFDWTLILSFPPLYNLSGWEVTEFEPWREPVKLVTSSNSWVMFILSCSFLFLILFLCLRNVW